MLSQGGGPVNATAFVGSSMRYLCGLGAVRGLVGFRALGSRNRYRRKRGVFGRAFVPGRKTAGQYRPAKSAALWAAIVGVPPEKTLTPNPFPHDTHPRYSRHTGVGRGKRGGDRHDPGGRRGRKQRRREPSRQCRGRADGCRGDHLVLHHLRCDSARPRNDAGLGRGRSAADHGGSVPAGGDNDGRGRRGVVGQRGGEDDE